MSYLYYFSLVCTNKTYPSREKYSGMDHYLGHGSGFVMFFLNEMLLDQAAFQSWLKNCSFLDRKIT